MNGMKKSIIDAIPVFDFPTYTSPAEDQIIDEHIAACDQMTQIHFKAGESRENIITNVKECIAGLKGKATILYIHIFRETATFYLKDVKV
jgi:hypothetical protein